MWQSIARRLSLAAGASEFFGRPMRAEVPGRCRLECRSFVFLGCASSVRIEKAGGPGF